MNYSYSKLKEIAQGGVSLLYVDEDPSVAQKLFPVFCHFFKSIDIAHSCQEAFALYEKVRHDIVVTDVSFKHENGYAFIEKVKALEPFQKIIITSSFLDRKRMLGLLNSVIYGYLLKPINVHALLAQLEKVAELIYEKKMLLFYITMLEATSSVTTEPNTKKSSENFLVFDNNERDETIHRMHYKNEDKISALRFIEEHYIDNETRSDLVMYAKELEEESAVYSELSPDYLAETSKLITIFANGLELSGEFRDIAYALRGLCKTLNELEQTHHLFGTSSRIIKRIIDSIIDDLVNWTSEVLIDLTAVDVHYVDASLLANIAQLSLTVKNMLKSEEETSLEDELELF